MSGKLRTALIAVVAVAIAFVTGNFLLEPAQAKGEISIGVGPPWTTSEVTGYIGKQILEDRGYDVKIITGDIGFTFGGVAKGDIDLYFDAWEPLQNDYLERYGKIDKLAVSYEGAVAGFFVPSYVEDINTVDDLVGNEHRFNGTVYTPGLGYTVDDATRAYLEDHPELNLRPQPSSEAALMVTIDNMTRRGQEVLFTFYLPQPLFARHDYKLLGGSVDYFSVNTVWVVANPGLAKRHPEVYEALQNWNYGIDEIQQAMARIDEGEPAEDVAREWVEANRDEIQSWWR